jgi:hypothetical protein
MRILRTGALILALALTAGACADAGPLLAPAPEAAVPAAPPPVEVAPTAETAQMSSLTVWINGPTLVPRWTDCEWWAGTSGGTWPYTYEWDVDGGFGNGYRYYWIGQSISVAMWLTVTVTDAVGRKGTSTVYINTSPSAPAC